MQAVKLAGRLGDYRCSQASSAALLHQQHPSSSPELVVPVFAMSSVTGLGLPILHAFLNALPALPHTAAPLMETPSGHCTTAQHAVHAEHAALLSSPHTCTNAEDRQRDGKACDVNDDHLHCHMDSCDGNGSGMVQQSGVKLAESQVAATHFQVDHTFEVKGVGCVVSGTLVSGEVAVGQILNLGPTGQGLFSKVQVTCIHRSQVQPSADFSCLDVGSGGSGGCLAYTRCRAGVLT